MDKRDSFRRHAQRGPGAFESVNDATFRQSPIPISDGLPRSLEFRRKSESWFSFPYHCLMNVEYHPHDRLTLSFSTHRVVLKGRNLETVYEQIRAQSCARVEEMDRATQFATSEDDPEIATIEVTKPGRVKEPTTVPKSEPGSPSPS